MSAAVTFWWVLTMLAVVWYSTITVYITIQGAGDIRHMLRRLSSRRDDA